MTLELVWIAICVLELYPALILKPLCVGVGLALFAYLGLIRRP